ncbi:MAG: hypothetical protein ABFC92_09965 [Rectinema sp.]
MARRHTLDSGSPSAGRLSPHETAQRLESFLARWRESGGRAIDAFALAAGSEDALDLLPDVPPWVECVGALVTKDRTRVLLWLKSKPSAGESNIYEKISAGVQLPFKRPQWRASRSVRIRYYVIPPSPAGGADALLSGLEQAHGSLIVLSPPGSGEMLIQISESR